MNKSDEANTNYYFFLQSGKHVPSKDNTLFYEVYSKIKNIVIPPELKDRLHILPMGFQDDDELAALYHRADLGIYNGGGLTTMEVNYGANGAILIHSEKKLTDEEFDKDSNEIEEILSEGFAVWEKGNVRYQKNEKGAKIVSPESFKKTTRQFIKQRK